MKDNDAKPSVWERGFHPEDKVGKYEFAAALGVSVRTIEKWRAQGRLPRGLKLGTSRSSAVKWRWGDVLDFVQKQEGQEYAA